MANKLQFLKIPNFTGGVNFYSGQTEIKDTEVSDMLNMDFVGATGLTKRDGYTTFGNSVDSKVTGLAWFKTDSYNEILRTSGRNLYRYVTASWYTIGGASLSNNLDTNFAQAQDKLFIFNGTDYISVYPGNGASYSQITASNPPKANYGIYYNQRIYCNDSTHNSRIYYTGTASYITSFNTASPAWGGYIDFLPGAGKKVMGTTKFGNYLYIFLENSFYRISPLSGTGATNALDHTVEMVSATKGTIAHRSIDQVQNDVFFADEEGINRLGEQPNFVSIRTTDLSLRIKPKLDTVVGSSQPKVSGIYYNYKYLYSYAESGATYNTKVLAYDVRYNSWLYWDNINANCWLDTYDTSSERHLYFGSDNSGQVYEMFQTTNDNGVAIDGQFTTKAYNLGEFSLEKLWTDVSVLFGRVYGNVDIDTYIDDNTISKSVTFGSSGSGGIGTFAIGLYPIGMAPYASITSALANDWMYYEVATDGTKLQLKFSNNNVSESFQVEGVKLSFKPFTHYKREADREII